jgi:hypothetical protein
MILLDTNVLSETIKPDAAPAVRHWLNKQAMETLYLSSITVAEVTFGVGAMPKGRRRDALSATTQDAFALFESRILPFDVHAARRYGELAVNARKTGKGFPIPDGYIAAIASAQGFAIATRDASAYQAAGLKVIDPWSA